MAVPMAPTPTMTSETTSFRMRWLLTTMVVSTVHWRAWPRPRPAGLSVPSDGKSLQQPYSHPQACQRRFLRACGAELSIGSNAFTGLRCLHAAALAGHGGRSVAPSSTRLLCLSTRAASRAGDGGWRAQRLVVAKIPPNPIHALPQGRKRGHRAREIFMGGPAHCRNGPLARHP